MPSTSATPRADMGVVIVILHDGTEVCAEYDGCEWLVHQDESHDAVKLTGSQVASWKPVE